MEYLHPKTNVTAFYWFNVDKIEHFIGNYETEIPICIGCTSERDHSYFKYFQRITSPTDAMFDIPDLIYNKLGKYLEQHYPGRFEWSTYKKSLIDKTIHIAYLETTSWYIVYFSNDLKDHSPP